jgi:RNA binding exosome subunit
MTEDTKFSGAEISLVIHATEDKEKIMKSLQDTLQILVDKFSIESLEGHYKNRILALKSILSNDEANKLASHISSNLSSLDRQEVRDNMNQFTDEKGNLYLRLDKQRLCQAKISISVADTVRVKFKPVKRYRPSSSLENYRGLFH